MPQTKILVFLFGLTSLGMLQGQYLTYTSDIKPIIEKHCVRCHSPGDVGGMPLTTYEEVAAYGQMIEYVTTTKLMPPWYADPSYSHFSNERVMSAEEIGQISHWVNNGMHEGALPYGLILSKTVAVTVIPRLPDTVISMSQAFEQYGIYMDQYQVFVLPTGLTEDRWIEGIEFVPGNKQIVRAAAVSIAPQGEFDSLDRWDPRYGYYSFGGLGKVADYPYWYTWSPQQKLTWYADGKARLLPGKSDLLVHIHYGPTGKPQPDSSHIRLWFSSKKTTQPVTTAPLINPYGLTNDALHIPANTKKTFHASYTVPYDMMITSLTPQANLICRAWEVYATLPNEAVPVKLLKIHDWNFNWKQTFHLPTPVPLPKGTVIYCLARYDNTLENLCNPSDRPVDIGWGAHLFNELFFVHVEYSIDSAFASARIHMPVVVSADPIQVSIGVLKKSKYALSLSTPDGNNINLLIKKKMKRGENKIIIDPSTVPYGNHVMQLRNKRGEVVAEQLFMKIWERGM